MSGIISKAQRGKDTAMRELYEMNKAQVTHICTVLLCNDSAVDSVVTKAFKLAFEQTVQGFYSSEEEFFDGVVQKAVNLCKSQVGKKNSKAFNTPINKNFTANITDDYIDSLDGQYAVFGYVTEGLDIVNAVCEAAEPTDDNGTIAADEQPVITSITIRTADEERTQAETDRQLCQRRISLR